MKEYQASMPLPPGVSKPAVRALHQHGIFTLDELATKSFKEVQAYHGVGPKVLRLLEVALAANGLSFSTD